MAMVPLVVMVVAAWLMASFWNSVDIRSPRQPFVAPTAGQTWIRSPEPGPHAFFRLNLPVDVIPQSATLWFTADQAAEPFVNGLQLADTPRIPTADGTYVPRVVETLDIRPSLVLGDNVVGLEVVNYDNRPPAFQARIRIESGGLVQTFGVSPSSWISTTNVALTGQALPRSGAFATTALRARRLGVSFCGRASHRCDHGLHSARCLRHPRRCRRHRRKYQWASAHRLDAPSTFRPVARTVGYGWRPTAPTPSPSTARPSRPGQEHGASSASKGQHVERRTHQGHGPAHHLRPLSSRSGPASTGSPCR